MSDEQKRQPRTLKTVLPKIGRVYGVIFEMAWSATRTKATMMLSLMVALGVAGAAGAWVSRGVVDGIADGHRATAILFGVLFLAVLGAQTLFNDWLQLLQVDMADRIGHEVDQRLMTVAAGAPGLDHLERSEFADRMKQVRERQWIPAQLLQQMGAVAFVVFGMLSALALLWTIHPLLSLLPFVMVPSAYIQYRSFLKHWSLFDEAAPDQRRADHFLKLSVHPTGAKEIRLFGLRDHVLAEHRAASDAYVRRMFRARMKQASRSTVGGVVYGVALTAAIAFIGWLALRGRATPGDVALGVQVARLALGQVEMAAELMAGLAEMAFMGDKYLWLLRYQPEVVVRADGEALPAPARIRHGITFEGVTFRYPGTDKIVLRDINLFLPARSTIALVGENGAGKSSIVKLLSRFYDPSEGRITIDGVDLREMDLEQWRAGMASAFQDFVRFEFIAREAVGVGDLPAIDDASRVQTAVGFAGASRVIDKLPQQLESQLGRQFEGGTDLSEGEWQRLAIARGSMRTTPALIVLDEPTASLDARAEHEVFERFGDLAGRAGSEDAPITVLVSHRFSTVRMASLIVVLHEGAIEELGSHEELIARGERYAELFQMQASRYD
ncbi:MAG TPA: ABC transporter ATP-binding protein [Actinomycetota bacterium]